MAAKLSELQGQAVNALYPLRRYLGGNADTAVYLTEKGSADGPVNAAIKLRPADPSSAQRQLEYWAIAASLSHPHLLRLLDFGRCTIAGTDLLFAVMEYADENLSEILPIRALEPAEIREMLRPTLSALEYLHSRQLVQGRLKPANVLVLADQLKLATDSVRPADRAAPGGALSRYDPPEAAGGQMSTAADVWALGVTLLEALLRPHLASVDECGRSLRAADVPEDLVQLIERCLAAVPQSRPDVAELQRWIDGTQGALAPTSPHAAPAASPGSGSLPSTSRSRALLLALVALLVAIWSGTHLLGSRQRSAPAAAIGPSASVPPGATSRQTTPQGLAAPTSAPVPAQAPMPPPSATNVEPPPVRHRQMPHVARSALATIHGRLKVVVWVHLDDTGHVTEARLRTPGPSRYFANAALAAARDWQFGPTSAARRECLLEFAFTTHGVSADARFVPPRS